MAFVRTIVQISGSSLLNINKHVKNSPGMSISFKKLFPSKVKPCKEKFLKFFKHCNEPATKSRKYLFKFKKPNTCHKVKPTKIKPSFWKHTSATKSKESVSSIYLTAYQKQMKLRQQDSRLSNPCYKLTPGDVLIYTKIINAKKPECYEPQPRLTPPYKVSKAALFKRVTADVERTLKKATTLESPNRNWPIIIYKKISIPFEEMRPSVKKKKIFNCKDGISAEDVIYPSNTANDFHVINTNFHPCSK